MGRAFGNDSSMLSAEPPMIYILRLTNGDCVVAMAADESGARRVAICITTLDGAPEIATIRKLGTFGVRFSPTEDGSLQVTHWDDATLDSIFTNEYPLLNEACERAHTEPFLPAANLTEPVLSQLKMPMSGIPISSARAFNRNYRGTLKPALQSRRRRLRPEGRYGRPPVSGKPLLRNRFSEMFDS